MSLPTPHGSSTVNGRRRHKHLPGDEALCKYASKACYLPRVIKKTDELHRYCDRHREQANRNQRRLEQRRRLRDYTSDQFSPSSQESGSPKADRSWRGLGTAYTSDESLSDSSDEGAKSFDVRYCSGLPVAVFEPFREPVELHAEDLASLLSIFATSV